MTHQFHEEVSKIAGQLDTLKREAKAAHTKLLALKKGDVVVMWGKRYEVVEPAGALMPSGKTEIVIRKKLKSGLSKKDVTLFVMVKTDNPRGAHLASVFYSAGSRIKSFGMPQDLRFG